MSLEAWLEVNLATWAPSTARDYLSRAKVVAEDKIGAISLARLSVQDIERVARQSPAPWRRGGRDQEPAHRSPRSARTSRGVVLVDCQPGQAGAAAPAEDAGSRSDDAG